MAISCLETLISPPIPHKGRKEGREGGRKEGRQGGRKEGIASAITIVTARGAYFILEAGEAAFWAQVFVGLKALMSF